MVSLRRQRAVHPRLNAIGRALRGFWLMAWVFSPGVGLAQVMCIPQAFGVPAMSGHPIWWDADGNNTIPDINHPAGLRSDAD